MKARHVMSFMVATLLTSASLVSADELSGIYLKESANEPAWLLIDGSGWVQRIPVTGEALKSIPKNAVRIWVEGVIRTSLQPANNPDHQGPRQKWVIVMEVKEAHQISKTFERPEAK